MPSPISKPGRFIVEATSRTPRLRDYDSSEHRYRDTYVNAPSYAISVDAFPGKILVMNRGDQQVPTGTDLRDVRDIWRLSCPPGTSGWNFKLDGRTRPGLVGRGIKVTQEGRRPLPGIIGVFDDDGDNNAWNWRFNVPGPGVYDITVDTLGKNAAITATRTHRIVLRDFLIVSIGDSAAAGEGNPDIPGRPADFDPDVAWWEWIVAPVALYKLTTEAFDWCKNNLKKNLTTAALKAEWKVDMDPAPRWAEERAHRSLLSAPAYAAALLEDRSKGTVVTHLPFGRSGSSIPEGLIGPRDTGDAWIGGIGQIREVANTVGKRHIDALLIWIGVNDVGVSGTLESLVGNDIGEDDTAARVSAQKKANVNLATFPERFTNLESALGELNVRHVYLIEYPTGLFNNANGVPSLGCGVFSSDFDLDITPRDAQMVRDTAVDINAAIQKEVTIRKGKGWFYVGGIARAFNKHGYCTTDTYFRGAEESLGLQGDTRGTIHPNQVGVKKAAAAIANAVRDHTIAFGDGTTPSPDQRAELPR